MFKLGSNLTEGTQLTQIRRKGVKIAPFKHRGPQLHQGQTSGAAITFKPKKNQRDRMVNDKLLLSLITSTMSIQVVLSPCKLIIAHLLYYCSSRV